MKTSQMNYVHIKTNETVEVIKVYRSLGIRYIVFWKDDPEPTVYTPTEFQKKFSSKGE